MSLPLLYLRARETKNLRGTKKGNLPATEGEKVQLHESPTDTQTRLALSGVVLGVVLATLRQSLASLHSLLLFSSPYPLAVVVLVALTTGQ